MITGNLQRQPNYFITAWILIAHLLALYGLFYFNLQNFMVFLIFYFLTGCLGITFAYHRLLTHRSFKMPKFLERCFSIFGVLALQGSPLEWVSHHRMHHAGSDTESDPHNASQGFWYSHWGWLFARPVEFDDVSTMKRFARDIANDRFYKILENIWLQVGLQLLLGIGLWYFLGLGAMLWGIFIRLVFVYHVTWLVNSASHMWGYKNYNVQDLSTNCWWVGFLAWGEGWHNNHHAFQHVAPAGHKWWEIDVTFVVIRSLEFFGLAWDVKRLPKLNQASSNPEAAIAQQIYTPQVQEGK